MVLLKPCQLKKPSLKVKEGNQRKKPNVIKSHIFFLLSLPTAQRQTLIVTFENSPHQSCILAE